MASATPKAISKDRDPITSFLQQKFQTMLGRMAEIQGDMYRAT
jgi:hypothetical protein